jgi:DNA-binding NarL/FixJ family response regulator
MEEGPPPLRVLIADDSPVIRERLAALLCEVPGVSVVAQAEDVPGTLEAARRLRPAVIILDLSMPGGTGLDVLRQMAWEWPRVVIIVLTNYASPEYERAARKQGASAFLNKSTEFMKVAELVRNLSNRAASVARVDGGESA